MVEKILIAPIPEYIYIINQKGTGHIKFVLALIKDRNDRIINMSPAQNSLSSFPVTLRSLEFTPL